MAEDPRLYVLKKEQDILLFFHNLCSYYLTNIQDIRLNTDSPLPLI